jgi:hypothetical protein
VLSTTTKNDRQKVTNGASLRERDADPVEGDAEPVFLACVPTFTVAEIAIAEVARFVLTMCKALLQCGVAVATFVVLAALAMDVALTPLPVPVRPGQGTARRWRRCRQCD